MTSSLSAACDVPSIKTRGSRLYDWLDERLGLDFLLEVARHKTVPQHRYSFWYYWGGLTLFFFTVQVVTGIFLLMYYHPGDGAYDSVRVITHEIAFGWLVRSFHAWSANLMVMCLAIHMFSVFFMKAYRAPREFGWWTGLALAGMTMLFGFSGYLLPMDDLAFFATKVGIEIQKALPGALPQWLPGAAMAQNLTNNLIDNLIQGGPTVSGLTVGRFFALHVAILPLLFLPLLAIHLLLIVRHGNAVPPSVDKAPADQRKSIPFFPNFFVKDLGMWLIAFNVLLFLCTVSPWPLGPQADPWAAAPEGIHPEWYFMSQFQLLKVLGELMPGAVGEAAGAALLGAGGLLWAFIPVYDTRRAGPFRAKTATAFGWLVLASLVFLTIWGYVGVMGAGK